MAIFINKEVTEILIRQKVFSIDRKCDMEIR